MGGEGTYTYKSGDIFHGTYKAGKEEGRGVYHCKVHMGRAGRLVHHDTFHPNLSSRGLSCCATGSNASTVTWQPRMCDCGGAS